MKNRIFALVAVVVLCLTMLVPVSAANTHIFDETNVLSDINSLEAYAQEIEETHNFSVLLSIVAGVGEEGTNGYCEAFYKANAKCENGIALTYNRGDNLYYFYCSGETKELFTEDVKKNTLWNAFAFSETYYEGAYGYLAAVDTILREAPADITSSDTAAAVTDDAVPTTEFIPSDRTVSLFEDFADVLTDGEEAELIARFEALGNEYDVEIGAITVDSYEGDDPQVFADNFYDKYGYGYGNNDDGLIIVFNTGKGDGNRNLAISTHGKGVELLTGLEIDTILEMMQNPIKNGDFASAFDTFVVECENAFDESISIIWIPLSILAGFGFAYLIVKIQASKLKTVRAKVNAADYVGEVVLTGYYDNFMYKNVISTPKAQSSSGGSTHTSASGRTHGGGNKSF